jgi:hypothetical protein
VITMPVASLQPLAILGALRLAKSTRLSHKKLTCLSVEIKVSGESINLSIQA